MKSLPGQARRSVLARSFLIIFLLCLLSACDRPRITGFDTDDIDTSRDPVQIPYKSDGSMTREVKSGRLMITPVAEYKISGMVVGKGTYSSNWDGEISPVDLAISWGRLADPGVGRHVTFTQGNRWYFYKCKTTGPFDPSYIISHSSNNHIIHASENIRKAVKAVKKKDRVVLEGFLVNLSGTYKEQPVAWNTSLSRTDSGSGSCELLYVLKVRIGTKVYE